MPSGAITLDVKRNPHHGDRWREKASGRLAEVLMNCSTPAQVIGQSGEPIPTDERNPAISGYWKDDYSDFAFSRSWFWHAFEFVSSEFEGGT